MSGHFHTRVSRRLGQWLVARESNESVFYYRVQLANFRLSVTTPKLNNPFQFEYTKLQTRLHSMTLSTTRWLYWILTTKLVNHQLLASNSWKKSVTANFEIKRYEDKILRYNFWFLEDVVISRRRQRGRAVRALELQSGGAGFVLGSPEFNSSVTLKK